MRQGINRDLENNATKILTRVQPSRPRKATSCTETRQYNVRIVKIDPPIFAQFTLLPNLAESYAVQLLFNRLDTTKVPRPL